MVKLDLTLKDEHTEIATAVAWSTDSQLLSVGDDKLIYRWTSEGEKASSPLSIGVFVTSLSWFPSSSKQVSDSFVVCCTDGSYRFMTRSGREEKKVMAHEGAVVFVKWSHDGSALLTAGEDGDIKTWSRSGNLRSCLVSIGQSIYCACWAPDDETVLVGSGKTLIIKAAQASKKNLSWNAHDGTVLCCDWNTANNLIVSGSEDCCYKVWDSFGRQLYGSRPLDTVITSVAWNPNGSFFVVGSFNLLRVCDKVGWTHSRDRVQCGSIMNIAWTPDGTQFACAGGNGVVIFAQVVDRHFEWRNTDITVISQKRIRVRDITTEGSEDIELAKDRVVEIGVGYDHLIVSTTMQCYIYTIQNLNTPIIFETKAPPLFLHVCKRHFLTADLISGVQVISFEGRILSSPKYQNFRADFLTKEKVALSADTVCMIDCADTKVIHVFDSTTSRLIGKIVHVNEVLAVGLNQINFGTQERLLVFLDQSRDLFVINPYVSSAGMQNGGVINAPSFKILSHVESFAWSDDTNGLATLADGKINFWFHPETMFIDRDLINTVSSSVDASEYGRSAQILSFNGSRVALRKIDGAVVYISSSIEVSLLDEFVRSNKWDEATRLCRVQDSQFLWGSLAALALWKRQLEVAEVAYAELREVAKVEHVQYIRSLGSDESKQAELALFRRSADEAEKILLQANPPLAIKAIRLNIDLFKWNRALDLALKYKCGIEMVLAYRQQFLEEFGQGEDDQKFLQVAVQFPFDMREVIEKDRRDEGEDKRSRSSTRK